MPRQVPERKRPRLHFNETKQPGQLRSSRKSLPCRQVDGVPNERKCPPGLASMLWPKAEHDDASFAHGNFSQGDFVFELVFATEPARAQEILVCVSGDHPYSIVVGAFKSRAINEIGIRCLVHAARNWISGIDIHSQDRTGTIEVR